MYRQISLFMLMAGLVSCSTARPDTGATARSVAADTRLVGTWELVSTRAMRGDSILLNGGPPEFRSLKILNNTHYSVITRRGGQFFRAGAGGYTLSGDTYTESVDLSSAERFTPGAVYTFRIRIDGDTWTSDGGSGATRFQEVWRRVR